MIAGLDTFREITGYDITTFFTEYRSFVANHYENILDYYNGADRVASSFAILDALNQQVTIIEPLIDLYRDRFQTIDAWIILDAYSDIFVALETINNMDRWTRSSRTTQFDSQIKVNRVLRQGETFETVLRERGVTNYDNAWARATIENYTIEEDYTSNGGVIFQINLQNSVNFNLPNIVDNLQENNVYGKDIKRGFVFENNDLITVISSAALQQTLDTILRTRKGSIPEFPEDGIENEVIGSNVNIIQYPTIFRNLLNIFRKDGRFSEVNLLDIFVEQDSVFMKLEVQSILKDSFVTNLNI